MRWWLKLEWVPTRRKAAFIEPMLLLRSESLPTDPKWQIELKLLTGIVQWQSSQSGRRCR